MKLIPLLSLVFVAANAGAVAWTPVPSDQTMDLLEHFNFRQYFQDILPREACKPREGAFKYVLLEMRGRVDSSRELPASLAEALQVDVVERYSPALEGFDFYETEYNTWLHTIAHNIKLTRGECRPMSGYMFFGFHTGHVVGLSQYVGSDTADRPAFAIWRELDIFLTKDSDGNKSLVYVWQDGGYTRALKANYAF